MLYINQREVSKEEGRVAVSGSWDAKVRTQVHTQSTYDTTHVDGTRPNGHAKIFQ